MNKNVVGTAIGIFIVAFIAEAGDKPGQDRGQPLPKSNSPQSMHGVCLDCGKQLKAGKPDAVKPLAQAIKAIVSPLPELETCRGCSPFRRFIDRHCREQFKFTLATYATYLSQVSMVKHTHTPTSGGYCSSYYKNPDYDPSHIGSLIIHPTPVANGYFYSPLPSPLPSPSSPSTPLSICYSFKSDPLPIYSPAPPQYKDCYTELLTVAPKMRVLATKHKLSEDELVAIQSYTRTYYLYVNTNLRKGGADLEKWQPYIKTLNTALDKLPNHVGTVVRGATLPENILKEHMPGRTVIYAAYTSTANLPAALCTFGYNGEHIYIKSKRGKSIKLFSVNSYEEEVLFRPGTRFKVISVEKPAMRSCVLGKSVPFSTYPTGKIPNTDKWSVIHLEEVD